MFDKFKGMLSKIEKLPIDEKIHVINEMRALIHEISPFKDQPIDFVRWISNKNVKGNTYNPNSVAPPEMQLLECSIDEDGYTQPIVSWEKDKNDFEIVDGFHRHRVGKECEDIAEKIHGYLPLTVINDSQTGVGDRMAATIRHNRARGKHSVDSMSDIVIELKSRNRSNAWIAKHLGMDVDEILRLTQISGLTDMFADEDFTDSWDIGVFEEGVDDSILEEEIDG